MIVARSGYLNPTGSITLFIREVMDLIPFVSSFYGCEGTEEVSIRIFDKFDNADFGLSSIEFLMPNDALQFKSSKVNVKTVMFGIRYLMREWFFTVALICISIMTASMCSGALVLLISLKYLSILPSWV
jgi:hypothetical protein